LVNSAFSDKPKSTLTIVDKAHTIINVNKGLLSFEGGKGFKFEILRSKDFLMSQKRIANQQKICIPALANGSEKIKKYKQYSIAQSQKITILLDICY